MRGWAQCGSPIRPRKFGVCLGYANVPALQRLPMGLHSRCEAGKKLPASTA